MEGPRADRGRRDLGSGRAFPDPLGGGLPRGDPVDRLLLRRSVPASTGPEVRLRHLPARGPRFAGVDARERGDRHQVAPFVALAFWPGSGAPGWAAAVLVGLGVLQIVTDLTLSTKSSDWKKFAREKGVARARRRATEPVPSAAGA